MKRSTWNPTRRNKNIGTEKSGYSQNNKLVVPERWSDLSFFYERLVKPVEIPLVINDHKITMLVEAPREGYIHACTPHDIIKLLELIPVEHLEEIELFALRQPKKKEEILKPVWGRIAYYADIGKHSGPCVFLEAVRVGHVIKWGKSVDPFHKKELRSLESHGHRIEKVRRGYEIHTTPESVRFTQLFRTVPHEIGHAIDKLIHSYNPSSEANSEAESEYISDIFDTKPTLDKEEYANRYAREFFTKWSQMDDFPFERIFKKESLESMGLCQEWFSY